jgi:biopolymer transport protein ExbD
MVLVLASKQGRPTLKLNYEDTSWEALQSSLTTLLQRQREKVVLVKADGSLPVAPVVNVIDVCRSTGAKVVLVTPGAEGAAQDTEVTITKGSAWGIVRLKPAAHFADE